MPLIEPINIIEHYLWYTSLPNDFIACKAAREHAKPEASEVEKQGDAARLRARPLQRAVQQVVAACAAACNDYLTACNDYLAASNDYSI